MRISKKSRESIKNKYNGLCAYSGTPLEDDWQVDHIHPKRSSIWHQSSEYKNKIGFDMDGLNDPRNLVPCQRIINHYKRALSLEEYRNWYLGELHLRLRKLPKNPKAEKSIKHKEYLLKVASYFGITEDKPFNKVFYFEKLKT